MRAMEGRAAGQTYAVEEADLFVFLPLLELPGDPQQLLLLRLPVPVDPIVEPHPLQTVRGAVFAIQNATPDDSSDALTTEHCQPQFDTIYRQARSHQDQFHRHDDGQMHNNKG